MSINIYYQDQYCLVVDKPAGLLTVPGRGEDKQDCLINRLKQNYPTALIVHRLDMATSGLLVVALTKQMHRLLSAAFANRQVDKTYEAIVSGLMDKDEGEIDLPLITDWPNRPKQKVCYEIGKPSLTKYQVISRNEAAQQTRVALFPITGRSHQLRVHMLSLDHPIVGDKLYNTKNQHKRLLLHAKYLKFNHPILDEIIAIESAPEF